MRRGSVMTDSAEKASRSKGIYQVEEPAWNCRKLLAISVRLKTKGEGNHPVEYSQIVVQNFIHIRLQNSDLFCRIFTKWTGQI